MAATGAIPKISRAAVGLLFDNIAGPGPGASQPSASSPVHDERHDDEEESEEEELEDGN